MQTAVEQTCRQTAGKSQRDIVKVAWEADLRKLKQSDLAKSTAGKSARCRGRGMGS
jgi:hypothetical protein